MASESILKSFMIRLGFKVDEGQQRRFQETMTGISKASFEITKNFMRVGEASVLGMTAAGAAMTAVAKPMEALYYAAQRTGSSAKELQTFSFAASQVGVSAEAAQASIEALAAARRTTPGLNGILHGMGIDPTQISNAKVMVELLGKLRNMPYQQATQVAGLFGLDEKTLKQLEDNGPEFIEMMKVREKIFGLAGIDPKEQGKRAHQYMVDMGILKTEIGSLVDVVEFRLMPAGKEVIEWLQHVVEWMARADKSTDGLSSKLIGLASAIAGGGILKGGLGVVGKMLGRTAAVAAPAAVVAGGAVAGEVAAGVAAKGVGSAVAAEESGFLLAMRSNGWKAAAGAGTGSAAAGAAAGAEGAAGGAAAGAGAGGAAAIGLTPVLVGIAAGLGISYLLDNPSKWMPSLKGMFKTLLEGTPDWFPGHPETPNLVKQPDGSFGPDHTMADTASFGTKLSSGLGNILDFMKGRGEMPGFARMTATLQGIAKIEGFGKPGTLATRRNNPGNIEDGKFAQTHGAIPSDGGRFAQFPTADTGFAAMYRLLKDKYSGKTLAEVIGRWAPSKENNTNAYIANLSKLTGISPNAVLLDKIGNAHANSAMLNRTFLTDTRSQFEAILKEQQSSKPITVSQKTDIHITGGDANGTAKEVARLQGRVNGDLVRNFAGAVN